MEEEGAHTFLREARAHGRRLQGLLRQFFSDFFLIFVLPTKIATFFVKVFLDHVKVYEDIESQTLAFGLLFLIAFLLGFGGFI